MYFAVSARKRRDRVSVLGLPPVHLVVLEALGAQVHLSACWYNQGSHQNTGLSSSLGRTFGYREQIRSAEDMHALHSTAYLLTQARVHPKQILTKARKFIKKGLYS
jgi:hypothetical protein